MGKSKPAIRLTKHSLQYLKDCGYLFVLIKGYSTDRRIDYMDLHYIILTPVKCLSYDPAKMEIYEPIDSAILNNWASSSDETTPVMIEMEIPVS